MKYSFVFNLNRAFSHLDLNSSVRSGNQVIHITDAHIRFERGTELIQKTPGTVEEVHDMYHFNLLLYKLFHKLIFSI